MTNFFQVLHIADWNDSKTKKKKKKKKKKNEENIDQPVRGNLWLLREEQKHLRINSTTNYL